MILPYRTAMTNVHSILSCCCLSCIPCLLRAFESKTSTSHFRMPQECPPANFFAISLKIVPSRDLHETESHSRD
ncbi:hypothetical protein K474DRAFT_764978 [Panus rudis PR-1116 ss-1]|nr:hypothetical protein K474DRAFT_764978 [Panus rudis PR-1116 ss-1]